MVRISMSGATLASESEEARSSPTAAWNQTLPDTLS